MEYTARGWRQLYNDRASAAPPMARDTSAFVKVLARSIRERTARQGRGPAAAAMAGWLHSACRSQACERPQAVIQTLFLILSRQKIF